jgi:hypothetical protein
MAPALKINKVKAKLHNYCLNSKATGEAGSFGALLSLLY